jgi:hypothetical protein
MVKDHIFRACMRELLRTSFANGPLAMFIEL